MADNLGQTTRTSRLDRRATSSRGATSLMAGDLLLHLIPTVQQDARPSSNATAFLDELALCSGLRGWLVSWNAEREEASWLPAEASEPFPLELSMEKGGLLRLALTQNRQVIVRGQEDSVECPESNNVMIDAFFSALSGLRTSSRQLQSSANNIANLQTPGFKKSTVQLGDVATGGTRVIGSSRSSSSGPLISTSSPLDLAINGRGFLQVSLPGGGTGFTRAGSLRVDSAGRLVDANNNPLFPEITVPGNHQGLTISSTGQVSALVNGQSLTLGQIQLAGFNNPGGLTSLGGNLFSASSQSGQPLVGTPGSGGLGTLIPGAVELSNVDIAEEVVGQILSKTAFRANASVIRTADEMTGTLLDIKA